MRINDKLKKNKIQTKCFLSIRILRENSLTLNIRKFQNMEPSRRSSRLQGNKVAEPTKKQKCDLEKSYTHVFVVRGKLGKDFHSFMIPSGVLTPQDVQWLKLVHGKHIGVLDLLEDEDPKWRAFMEIGVALGEIKGMDISKITDGLLGTKDLIHQTGDWKKYGSFDLVPAPGKVSDFIYLNTIDDKMF